MHHFQDVETWGPISGDNVCQGCGKVGASVGRNHRGKPVGKRWACRSCQAELRGLRQAAEERRTKRQKAAEKGRKGK